MAGSNAAFNAAAFRRAIRDTMVMGLPNTTAEKPTFKWTMVRDYLVDDPADKPYDWTATPTVTETHVDVQVPCAVEFAAKGSGSNAIGEFDTSRVILTLLDEDYDEVRGADQVIIGGNTYGVDFVGPPMGLFEVTVYQVYCSAVDET